MRQIILASLALFLFIGPARAADPEVENALKNCLAAQPDKPKVEKKSGPLRHVLKGLAGESKASFSDMGKDMVFVFSCQDIDPYAKKAPTNKPYTEMTVQLVDGSICSLVRYPDTSAKVEGGFADQTIIAPLNANTFVVGYPNGARGRMEKLPGGIIEIHRPDNTVTTFKKSEAGRYSIRNTKLGYMGEAVPDRNGVGFEFQ